jgi:catechol 2,3-dioxygenase-like lactoylglutathione lyase family enzyme
MLGTAKVHPILLAKDLGQAKSFYHGKLGLEVLGESDHKIEFRCGGGTKLAVSKSTVGTADSQTQIGWEVESVEAEVDDLRSRGVRVEDYDLPGLKTEDGIADVGFARMAWIIDPGHNALAIVELKRQLDD